ncbi:type VI secretion system Vgr family protein [Ideonella sp. A 288]|uniref:type VI secretion system Vgr family protein n=1 Tax=Ideonella sp. A 288 TaxID=1962181 RepID=UPI000B4BAE5B|nr:type VI secretion system tip protein VgrG [Ideonella sp. A 288]
MPPPITISTPLPAADLRFASLAYTARLNTLEEMRVRLIADRPDLLPEALLGQPVDVAIALRDGATRHLHGHVTRFGLGTHQGRHFGYEATVRPWLWFLTRTSDCRIFQHQTVPQIVSAVFADHGAIAKFEFRLFGTYRSRTYTVQYRETDFNFIARLLEDEGIAWYFEHAAGEHKLVLVDAAAAHPVAAGCADLPFYGNAGQVSSDVEYISDWHFARSVETGRTALSSYDFEKPSALLGADQAQVRGHSLADHEQFDWQGDYTQAGEGQHLAGVRLEELQSRHEHLSGATNAHGLAVGQRFGLSRHPREDLNTTYLCLHAHITAQVNAEESGQAAGQFHCSFSALPATQQFRPPRTTPKPFVQGPQTAVVVGPAGQEIFTDQYGRVKVQFHWDRYGQRNESSSCWVRTSSPWAGKSFGFVQVPRIGQEVVVDFLEGDPDQPLITGRVYNAEQMPPWELPANATQSGVLSRSSLGGAYSHANALRFEDKKGEEQLWLHAEKDQLTEVEHDEDKWVGNDRRKTIDRDETNHIKRDRTETVDRNEKITVHGWRTEEVDGDETITIHQNRTERVDLNEKISIGKNRSEDVELNEQIEIGQNRSEFVGANETVHIGGSRSVTIGGAKSESVGATKTETIAVAKALSIGAGYAVTVGGAMNTAVGLAQFEEVGLAKTTMVGMNYSNTVGDTFSLSAGKAIQLKVGKASLTMTEDGKVTIVGTEFLFDASGPVQINGKDIDLN